MLTFKVGIIGAGRIVENSHLPVLKTHGDLAVSWIYDKDARRSALLSSMYQVTPLHRKQLQEGMDDIDVCLLTIPYGVRKEYIALAAEKQKALYVEKPFAIGVREHEGYCGLFAPHKLAVGFQRRYYQIVSTLRSLITSRIFGELTGVVFTQGHFGLKGGNSYLSNAALAGGGVIVESAIHALDQILMITNAVSVNVLNVKSVRKRGIDYDTVFDSEVVMKECHKVGVRCEITSLRNLGTELLLQFTNAALRTDLSPHASLMIEERQSRRVLFELCSDTQAPRGARNVSESFSMFWAAFVESLRTGHESLTLGQSSVLTTSWIEQIYRRIQIDT